VLKAALIYLLDERAGCYFIATALPGISAAILFISRGCAIMTGTIFNGTSTYRLRLPKGAPARDFWSVIVYGIDIKGSRWSEPH
jgi:hypothetical protein